MWDVDLVVSGHDHGGQVVVPFAGGVFGGDQGYFPKYVHGMYEKERLHLFVSSGLGSANEPLPRVIICRRWLWWRLKNQLKLDDAKQTCYII